MARRPRVANKSRVHGATLAPTPVHSTYTTPSSSAFPSAYPSEDEDDGNGGTTYVPMRCITMQDFHEKRGAPQAAQPGRKSPRPFRFLDLPAEIRLKIYALHFADTDPVIDLHHENHKRVHKTLSVLRTCRKIYSEASHFFYSTKAFRLFSTHPGRFFRTRRQLLARLKPHQRQCITKLELRLGPGWSKPPAGWVVTDRLGLADCVNVHTLTVFVQLDPSSKFLEGFRKEDGFYERFSRDLLDHTLAKMPLLPRVEFDAYESVSKSCLMVQSLLHVAQEHRKLITWGPEREWNDRDEVDEVTQKLDSSVVLEALDGITPLSNSMQSVLIMA